MIKRSMALWGETILSWFKYFLAVFMMFAGIVTGLGPLEPAGGDLGWIYASREALVSFGLVFFASGATLFYGKLRKSRKWTGRGLMAIYLCFLFAAILNVISLGLMAPAAWSGNLIASIVVGLLYLRWRFKTEYVDPNHFIRDIEYHSPKDDDNERD